MKKLFSGIGAIFTFQNPVLRAVNIIISFALVLYIATIVYPDFMFSYSVKYGNLKLHSRTKLDDNIYNILVETKERLDKSVINDTTITHNIYICNSYSLFSFLAPLSSSAFACNYPGINSIFVANADIAANEAHKNDVKDSYKRKLSSLLAHEITHSLIENKLGIVKNKMLDSWKNEGYAEVVGYNEPFDVDAARKFLTQHKSDQKNSVKYRRYFYAVSYLLQVEKMQFDDIVKSDVRLDQVLEKIVSSSSNVSR